MSCCAHEEHDYCCLCSDGEVDRARQMIEDVLDGSYRGDADIHLDGIEPLATGSAALRAEAIIAVLIHEDVL